MKIKQIYKKFNNACKEVKAIQKGKLPITTLRDIINELKKK